MSLPNQLTLLRILLTPIIALLLFRAGSGAQISALAVFIIASLTDWYDGYTARKYGYVTTWGKFFDPLADKILVTTVLICFCCIGYFPAWMVIVVVVRDSIITTLRSYAIFKGKCMVTSYLAKAKTFVQMGVLYIIFFYHLVLTLTPPETLSGFKQYTASVNGIVVLMSVLTILTVISGISYIVGNRVYIKEMGNELYRIFVPSDS